MDRLELINKMDKWWVSILEVNQNGNCYIPWEDIGFSSEHTHIKNDISYKLLKKKMKNLVYLLNKDFEKTIMMDIDEELWNLI